MNLPGDSGPTADQLYAALDASCAALVAVELALSRVAEGGTALHAEEVRLTRAAGLVRQVIGQLRLAIDDQGNAPARIGFVLGDERGSPPERQ